jgi:hypothetical protein
VAVPIRRSAPQAVAVAGATNALHLGRPVARLLPGRKRPCQGAVAVGGESTTSTDDAFANAQRELVFKNPSQSSRRLTTSRVVRPVVDRDEAGQAVVSQTLVCGTRSASHAVATLRSSPLSRLSSPHSPGGSSFAAGREPPGTWRWRTSMFRPIRPAEGAERHFEARAPNGARTWNRHLTRRPIPR